jgi:glycosyltransferase involved in cell wall biosynthesis
MKILHVVHRYWPAYGGCERYMQTLSEYLAHQGHKVTVWTTNALDVTALWERGKRHVDAAEEDHEGVHIHRFPLDYFPIHRYAMRVLSMVKTRRGRFLFSPGAPRVPEMIREAEKSQEQFDLVHATPFPYDPILYAGMRMAMRHRIPLVVTPFIHLGEGPACPVRKHYSRRHQIDLLRSAQAVLVQTRREREFLADLWVSGERLHLVGTGIDPEALSGGNARRFREKHRLEGPLVAHIAVRCRDKGTFDLIRACESLWQANEKFHLVLVGESTREFDQELASLSEATRSRCLVVERISEEEKRDLLAAMDLLALPSRTDSFGIVLLEAWCYRKPVIAARAGGVEEVVEDAGGGCLVPFGDHRRLANAMNELLSDTGLRDRLGESGHRKTLSAWTWDRLLPRIERIYETLI